MHTNGFGRILIILILASFASACSATRPAEPWKCAMVGAAVGGLGGTTVGAGVVDDDDDTTQGALIGAGAGIVAGALTGFTVCALMPESVAEAPPPPPPARAAPVVKKTVVLPGVHFGFDRADLLAPAKSTLDAEVIPELRADPSLSVLIEGHTDAVGSDAYNQRLSERRAETVREYLMSQGVSASRIETRGYGESHPIADNESETGRASNRRVEIKVLQ
jgi:OOP family OmpA-OmpF porin